MAAGHWVGGEIAWSNSSLPGRSTFWLTLLGFGMIDGDFSSLPRCGGKYAACGLFPCGISLSRGGRYWLFGVGLFACGRGGAGVAYGRGVVGLGWYWTTVTLCCGVGLGSAGTRQQTSGAEHCEAYWKHKTKNENERNGKNNRKQNKLYIVYYVVWIRTNEKKWSFGTDIHYTYVHKNSHNNNLSSILVWLNTEKC